MKFIEVTTFTQDEQTAKLTTLINASEIAYLVQIYNDSNHKTAIHLNNQIVLNVIETIENIKASLSS